MNTTEAYDHRYQDKSGKFQFSLRALLLFVSFVAVAVACVSYLFRYIDRKNKESFHRWVYIEMAELNEATHAFRIHNNNQFLPKNDLNEIQRFVNRAFPNHQENFQKLAASGIDFSKMDDSEALVFWLNGGTKENPLYPIKGPGKHRIYYEFDKKRLIDRDGDGWFEYLPRNHAYYSSNKAFSWDGKSVLFLGADLKRWRSHPLPSEDD